jgi:hypothetical protein
LEPEYKNESQKEFKKDETSNAIQVLSSVDFKPPRKESCVDETNPISSGF